MHSISALQILHIFVIFVLAGLLLSGERGQSHFFLAVLGTQGGPSTERHPGPCSLFYRVFFDIPTHDLYALLSGK